MSDARDFIIFSPRRKVAARLRGFGDLSSQFSVELSVPPFELLEADFTGSGDLAGSFSVQNAVPVANAGPDATHDQITTPAYVLAGSAVGQSITYSWTKQSGPGTVSFVDSTNPTTSVTFQWPGSYVLRLTATNGAGSHFDDVTITVTATMSALMTLMGSKTKFAYVVGVSSETLNGSNFSQLNDLGPDARHLVQGSASLQPAKNATGGPLGDSCLDLNGTDDYLINTAISVASGAQLWFLEIGKAAMAGATRIRSQTRTINLDNGNIAGGWGESSSNFLALGADATTGQFLTVGTPARDGTWRVWTTEYFGSGRPETRSNSAAAQQFNLLTGPAAAIEAVIIGHHASSGGSIKAYMCFDAPTTAQKTAARQAAYALSAVASG